MWEDDGLGQTVGDDSMGSSTHQGVNLRHYAQTEPRREHDIEYHLVTNHTSGGANCRAYFLISEIEPG